MHSLAFMMVSYTSKCILKKSYSSAMTLLKKNTVETVQSNSIKPKPTNKKKISISKYSCIVCLQYTNTHTYMYLLSSVIYVHIHTLHATYYTCTGHGGSEASTFAKENLINCIVNQKLFWSDDDQDVLRAIEEGYIDCHYAMWREQGIYIIFFHIQTNRIFSLKVNGIHLEIHTHLVD